MRSDLFGREIPERRAPVAVLGSKPVANRTRREVSTRVEHADMLEAIPCLVAEGVVVDAVVTDPPYHLSPMHKRFGQVSSSPPGQGRDGALRRLSSGFMGQQWDGGDIAFRAETWATVASIMRPGAFLVAFGGTRTHHRVWCAIEDAGFVIQDTIAWLFGSGFPKRRDMLKPAFEPLCLAYKPGGKRMMQVDECRIATNEDMGDPHRFEHSSEHPGWHRQSHTPRHIAERGDRAFAAAQALGRWPANVVLENCDEVVAAFPDSVGQQGDVRGTEPSARFGANGIYGHAGSRRLVALARGKRPGGFGNIGADKGDPTPNGPQYGDNGSAARFFYQAKADKGDRLNSRHLTVKPVELMRWLVRLVTPEGGLILDPFAGSGSTGAAAILEGVDSILIEREAQYITDIRAKIAHFEKRRQRTLY